MIKLMRPNKRRAVSPVIATVIIVAVTITVAVAVSYWMSGIASQYTAFEKVEIQSAECTYDFVDQVYWEIIIDLKNTGTKTATLTDVFVNDKKATLALLAPTAAVGEITAYLFQTGETGYETPFPLSIESGDVGEVKVWIDTGGKLSAGTTVNIKIHSAGGMDYIQLVQLT